MLKVNVDKREIDVTGLPCGSFRELINSLSGDLIKDKFITRLILDGEEYTQEELETRSFKERDEELLEIETTTPEDMKKRGFDLLEEYMTQIVPQMEKASELLRVADEFEANQFYATCLEDLKLLIQLIEDIESVLHMDFAEVHFCGTPIRERVERLSSLIQEMLSSQKDNDWIMLADLIEYELIPLLEEWKEIMMFVKDNF